ncbi:hypothetical protein ACFP2T_43365 [Plantactinospora solaniradicis]|uniref:Uncharacterized protein n=1 Tax=Plantactinospora solaniradicis TaxID=1723736 RepID=A0ABW1KQ34_9ACTN
MAQEVGSSPATVGLTREQALVAWDALAEVFPTSGKWEGMACHVESLRTRRGVLEVLLEHHEDHEWVDVAQVEAGNNLRELMSSTKRHDMYNGQGPMAPLVKRELNRAQVAEESWKARNRPAQNRPWFSGFKTP